MVRTLDALDARLTGLVLGGLLAVAALLAYRVLFKSDLGEFRRLSALRAASAAEVAVEAEKVDDARRVTLEAEVGRLETALFGTGVDLPQSQLVAHIIGKLDELSSRHRVALRGVTPGGQSELLTFRESSFDISVTGGYFDLFDWLRAAENELRPMVVKQFDLRRAEGEAMLQMKLRVVSYQVPRGGG